MHASIDSNGLSVRKFLFEKINDFYYQFFALVQKEF